MKIPLSSPDITEAEIKAVIAVMRTSRLSLGPQLEAFEAAFADYVGVECAAAVSSGTAGLHLCMRVLNIGAGDEVIVPSFTFIAAANVIRYEQAMPVFVDIQKESLNMSPSCVESAITEKTRAIMVVHTFGRPAEMTALLEIARRHRLAVIEDACEAIGAEYGGRRVGSFGDVAVFGFYPNKQITTGEGGMVVTRSLKLAERIRALRNQGRYQDQEWLQHAEIGFNYRLSEINCALGLAQLKRINEILQSRAQVAQMYHELLSGVRGLVLPAMEIVNGLISWFVYVVRLDETFTLAERDTILEKLRDLGIGCARYFAPVHLQPSYSDWRCSCVLPVTEIQGGRTIALPFFNRITKDEVAYVCAALRAALLELRCD
jgi:dTDP-4-amino-4,6-dideoxygalactose transaminase